MQERHLCRRPIHHAVSGKAEHRGRGVPGIESEVHWEADATEQMSGSVWMRHPVRKSCAIHEESNCETERVGSQPLEPRLGS